MIVKIVRNGVDTYYECRRAWVYDEVGPEAKITLEDDPLGRDGFTTTTIQVDKSTTHVYILNDSGKTVDSYKWNCDSRGVYYRPGKH